MEEKENYDGAEKKDKFTILSSLHKVCENKKN